MSSRTYEEERAINLVEGIEPAETEYNVEEVLRKQDTHDLFCPSCCSCISRRVVLRKRRLGVPRYRPTVVIPAETEYDVAPAKGKPYKQDTIPLSGTRTDAAEVPSQYRTGGGLILFQFFDVFGILKSIVYGGLMESLASLVIVLSAAGAGAATSNTLALALANLIGGLFILVNNLVELKNGPYSSSETETDMEEDRYSEQLGRRGSFCLHSTVAVLSFLFFGSVAPITYGFSFRKSDDREYKLAVVAAASLVCIFLLSLAKARVKQPPKLYIRTVLYYLVLGLTSSVISFFVGDLVGKILARVDLLEPGSSSSSGPSVPKKMISPSRSGWPSY